jgi:hypothetical protein
MAATVGEVMNCELLSFAPGLSARQARDMLRSFGIGAAPVVDDFNHPIGVLSLRDLFEADGTTRQRMRSPALSVPSSMTLETAARCLVARDIHHLIVVDATGAAIGMLSALDVLRAFLGVPPHHPSAFPHWDPSTGVTWTDDWQLTEANLAHAPEEPGVLVLVSERARTRDTIVWVEACTNLRAELSRLVRRERVDTPELARALTSDGLCFRTATVREDARRDPIARLLRYRVEHVPPPGAT